MLARVLLCLLLPLTSLLAADLTFEAEDWSEPKDAWLANQGTADRWNLWSTDQDADKKWSGGVVLQSPVAKQDRADSAAGAPALHTRLAGIPNGTYDVALNGTRTLGISFDGQSWQPTTGGVIARGVAVTDGTFELWVDDRYRHPAGAGFAYYDFLRFQAVVPLVNGVANPGYELLDGDPVAGWNWWSREGGGGATLVTEVKHGGERAVRLQHTGERDYAFSNSGRRPVAPEQEYLVRAWVKSEVADNLNIAAVGEKDGQQVTWDMGSAGTAGAHDWRELKAEVWVPAGVNSMYVRWSGQGNLAAWVDDISIEPQTRPAVQKPAITGFATQRVVERLDRGLLAISTGAGVQVSWRLLAEDPASLGFNLYRDGQKLNAQPLTATTEYQDSPAPDGATYTVRPVAGGQEGDVGGRFVLPAGAPVGYTSLKLEGDPTFGKIGIGDLDGDGQYDYVLKTPNANIDPYVSYWQKSPETYRLEAYRADGTLLWRKDLGWGIERGIWYSPYLVYDFDGDGSAEVAAKYMEGDPRDPGGRVTSGQEWLVVWDGVDGAEIARVPWPSREGFGDPASVSGYNYAARNQLAVAYLDGKTPCLVALRGTYRLMKAEAWQLSGQTLEPLWQYTSDDFGRRYRGQGAHFTHAADVDGDGRDEIVLGSAVIDDNGVALWSTGLGHPDHAYVGDLDPGRPGLEIYYGIETRQKQNGMATVDAATGQFLWGWDQPTQHVHSTGTCADFDPTVAGAEAYSADSADHKPTGDRWLWAVATGELLTREVDWGFGARTAYWDADLQREIQRGSGFVDYGGGSLPGRTEGSIVQIVDLLGDWREEVVCTLPGELRIYSTPIPAADRRPTLMQDPIYRLDTAMCAMGYTQNATTSYSLEARSPNLNLTAMDAGRVRVVAVAPLDRAMAGAVRLSAVGATVTPADIPIKLAAGERLIRMVEVAGVEGQGGVGVVQADLIAGDLRLPGRLELLFPDPPLRNVPMAQAEAFTGQGGGEVQKRDDKAAVVGQAISHWDHAGHWLTWNLDVPADGRYRLIFRYSAGSVAERTVRLGDLDCGRQRFPNTGGFGANASEWLHQALESGGKPRVLELQQGRVTLRMENVGGQGLNLDYLALVPVT